MISDLRTLSNPSTSKKSSWTNWKNKFGSMKKLLKIRNSQIKGLRSNTRKVWPKNKK